MGLQTLCGCLIALALLACSGGNGGPDAPPSAPDAMVEDAGPDAAPSAPDAMVEDAGPDAAPGQIANGTVVASQQGDDLVLENGRVKLVYRLSDGRFDAEVLPDGRKVLQGVDARFLLLQGTKEVPFLASSLPFGSWSGEAVEDPLGPGVAMAVVRDAQDGKGPKVALRLELRSEGTYLLTSMVVTFPPSSPWVGARLRETQPLFVEAAGGGALFIGADPSKHVVADNGSDMLFDFAARVYRMGKGNSVFFPWKGSVANWSAGIFDPESKASVTAGYFTFEHGMGMVAMDYAPEAALEDAGRKGFTRLEAFTIYEPACLLSALPDGKGIESELFYLDLAPPTPFDGLEQYAARYAKRIGKTLWTDIPTGWNSWGGGGGTSGGPGHDIDEPFVLANLEAMEQEFKPFDMKWFFIDDGWQVDHGDWVTNPERFPDHDGMEGMAWMAKEIKSRGLRPGIWIAPFWIKKSSQVAKDHPDWWADVSDLGHALVGDADLIPDLTKPEVLDWVRETFVRVTQEWGYDWIKMDFSYYALFAENLSDPTVTASAAYHNAMRVIREAMGPDKFLLGISAMGLCFDEANGGRLTLDNMPVWGDDEDQGIKITLRTAAHRYYLNWLWANHPDLLFYRPLLGLTSNEARAWTSVVALMGGIVKLGETYTAMQEHPEWEAMVRPILPVYPVSARPLDMFELLHPEVWWLSVEREGRTWNVVGLYNWGENEDVQAGKTVPEETRTKTLALEDLGLDPKGTYLVIDGWDHDCYEVSDGLLSATLEPRTDKVLIVRPVPEEPGIVATSRHLLGGAVEVTDEQVKTIEGKLVLSATIDHPAGYPLDVYVSGSGLKVDSVQSPGGVTVTPGACDGLEVLSLTPTQSPVKLEVTFAQ
ncbi:MAG: alpha-galactosidase [Deltaproteobacteria bacterium]|nr:alpha-galactosidase [Deltaproteobacteria bacterium]